MEQEIEIWLPVAGYSRYEVSDLGRVRNCNGLILHQERHYKGHLKVRLYPDSPERGKLKFVHRLVAIAFIPNPKNLPIVNHKDLVKQNNHISNLEWCTESENTQHYFDNRSPNPLADMPF